jgi:hypothetical protein
MSHSFSVNSNMSQPSSPSNRGGQSFFSHDLPRVGPRDYLDRYDAHLGQLDSAECATVMAAFAAASRKMYTAGDFRRNGLAPFQTNDKAQALLDVPVERFAAGTDGWERHAAAVAGATGALKTFAVACLAHGEAAAHVDQSADGNYCSARDGLFLHVWTSASQAQRFMSSSKAASQAIFELNLRLIRHPVSVAFTYRGAVVTVTPLVPLPDTDAPAIDAAPGLALEAEVLRHTLGAGFGGGGDERCAPTTASLGLQRGADGRVYCLSAAWRSSGVPTAVLSDPGCDGSALLRPEAAAHLPDDTATAAAVRFGEPPTPTRGSLSIASPSPSSPSSPSQRTRFVASATTMRRHQRTVGCQRAAGLLLARVADKDNRAAVAISSQLVATALHATGVNMSDVFAVLGCAKEIAPRQSATLDAAAAAIEFEMVSRALKELVRAEALRGAGAHDDNAAEHLTHGSFAATAAHTAACVNRLFRGMTSARSGVWSDALMPLLRRKFDAPAEYIAALTPALLKMLVTYARKKLGATFDDGALAFVGFDVLVRGTTFFAPPAEMASQVTSGSRRFFSAAEVRAEGEVGVDIGTRATYSRVLHGLKVAGVGAGATDYVQLMLQQTAALLERRAAFLDTATGTVAAYGPVATLLRAAVLLRVLSRPNVEVEQQQGALVGAVADAPPASAAAALYHRLLAAGECKPAVLDTTDAVAAQLRALLADPQHRRAAADDIPTHARVLMAIAARTRSEPVLRGALQEFRGATWTDVGLLPEYFRGLAQCASLVDAGADPEGARLVLRLAERVVTTQDARGRRNRITAVYRKALAEVARAADAAACKILSDVCGAALQQHIDFYGHASQQTALCNALCLFATAHGHAAELTDEERAQLATFHRVVLDMAAATKAEEIRLLLAEHADEYNASFTAVLGMLTRIGETVTAQKAMSQSNALASESQGAATFGIALEGMCESLQSGAAGRLQGMVRHAANIGPQYLFRRLERCSSAYVDGVYVVERDERDALARAMILAEARAAMRAEVRALAEVYTAAGVAWSDAEEADAALVPALCEVQAHLRFIAATAAVAARAGMFVRRLERSRLVAEETHARQSVSDEVFAAIAVIADDEMAGEEAAAWAQTVAAEADERRGVVERAEARAAATRDESEARAAFEAQQLCAEEEVIRDSAVGIAALATATLLGEVAAEYTVMVEDDARAALAAGERAEHAAIETQQLVGEEEVARVAVAAVAHQTADALRRQAGTEACSMAEGEGRFVLAAQELGDVEALARSTARTTHKATMVQSKNEEADARRHVARRSSAALTVQCCQRQRAARAEAAQRRADAVAVRAMLDRDARNSDARHPSQRNTTTLRRPMLHPHAVRHGLGSTILLSGDLFRYFAKVFSDERQSRANLEAWQSHEFYVLRSKMQLELATPPMAPLPGQLLSSDDEDDDTARILGGRRGTRGRGRQQQTPKALGGSTEYKRVNDAFLHPNAAPPPRLSPASNKRFR